MAVVVVVAGFAVAVVVVVVAAAGFAVAMEPGAARDESPRVDTRSCVSFAK